MCTFTHILILHETMDWLYSYLYTVHLSLTLLISLMNQLKLWYVCNILFQTHFLWQNPWYMYNNIQCVCSYQFRYTLSVEVPMRSKFWWRNVVYHLLYDKGHYLEGLLDHHPFTLIFINTLLLATDFFSDYTVVNCSYFCVHIKKR